jgi:tRNA dimethylallyltransferase
MDKQDKNLPPTIALLGPTASGKSALAMTIAARHPVEIISVDSAQVFRGMDVGTAKPTATERLAVPHHLIDIIDPTDAYSAARFRAEALILMQEICARGCTPVLVGGTMLYFKTLREGLSDLPAADPALRAALELEATRHGWPRMHARLAEIDPPTAARLKPTDAQRIQRALEVHHLTGKPLSSLQQRSGAALALPVRMVGVSLVPSDRAQLHQRIAARFDAMLAAGLVDELKELKKRFALRADLPAMRCVGYRQAWEYLAGDHDRAGMRDKGVFATRQLAKRQLTWLRAMPELQEFDCLAPDLEQQVLDYLNAESVF